MGTWPGKHARCLSGADFRVAEMFTREGGPMATTGSGHVPVMIDRVLALLAPALQPEGSVLLDATLGRAGHAGALLDMRMNRSGRLTAADVVNTYSAARLAQVLREYGEERFARRIADAVVRARSQAPFTSTMRLGELVRDSIPPPARRHGGPPAHATFQA